MDNLLLANLYFVLFYSFYLLFLYKETFFQLNRIYLLATAILSFVLPYIALNGVYTLFDPSAVKMARSSFHLAAVSLQEFSLGASEKSVSTGLFLFWIYLAGCVFQAVLFIIRLSFVKKQLNRTGVKKAYAFFRIIQVDEGQAGRAYVLEHEKAHAKQCHSIDILFGELLKILNWFNPIVYFFCQSLKLTHEYLADDAVNRDREERIAYAELLLNQTFSVPSPVLANPFVERSFVKRRIFMLFKTRSTKLSLVRYALLIPLLTAMIVFSSAKLDDMELIDEKPAIALEEIMIDQKPKEEALSIREPVIGKPVKTPEIAKEKIIDFNLVEVQPTFPGGLRNFYQWVGQHYNYPSEAKQAGIRGTVYLSFVIESNGEVTDIKVLRDVGFGTGEEAVKLLKSSPRWRPAIQNGRAVRVSYSLPIRLDLQPRS